MIVKYDEENFSIKLYRDFVKGELVGLMEVIPIDELLEVWADRKTEPTSSKMEQVDKDINVRSKTEPQTDCEMPYKDCEDCETHLKAQAQNRKTEPQRTCDNCGTPRDKCVYCIEEDKMWTPKTEPQTETPKMIRKRIDKPFRVVWLDDDYNEIGTTQTERAETMSCQECKWWFTDSLKHGGYCQSLLYNHECHYEPEVDCSWK